MRHQNHRTAPARERRQQAVLRLVGSRKVRSQGELAALLAEEGLLANQATLSRDLRELGLVKGPGGYAVPPGAGKGDSLTAAVGQWLRDAVPVEHQVVLKTPPSGAQPLALALDRALLPDVVGTIAGDDTVLVICSGKRPANALARRFRRWRSA